METWREDKINDLLRQMERLDFSKAEDVVKWTDDFVRVVDVKDLPSSERLAEIVDCFGRHGFKTDSYLGKPEPKEILEAAKQLVMTLLSAIKENRWAGVTHYVFAVQSWRHRFNVR